MNTDELLGCPFCGCDMEVDSNQDYHRLVGAHPMRCVLYGIEIATPATDVHLIAITEEWNTRYKPQPSESDAELLRWLDSEIADAKAEAEIMPNDPIAKHYAEQATMLSAIRDRLLQPERSEQVQAFVKPPKDVCAALAKLFTKLDEEDRYTVNWLLAAHHHVRTTYGTTPPEKERVQGVGLDEVRLRDHALDSHIAFDVWVERGDKRPVGMSISEHAFRAGYRAAIETQPTQSPAPSLPEGYVLVNVVDCPIPNCDNQGYWPVQLNEGEFSQEQCEFCYTTPNSRFNLQRYIAARPNTSGDV